MTITKDETPTRTGRSMSGAVTGRPRLVLRLEGAVLLVASLAAFAAGKQSWWLVPLVLFLPDVFMAGYVRSNRLGALTYNLAHSYPLPAAVGGLALAQDHPFSLALAIVWFAHIGMDRALGYGLKYDNGFAHTHLGPIGRGWATSSWESKTAPGPRVSANPKSSRPWSPGARGLTGLHPPHCRRPWWTPRPTSETCRRAGLSDEDEDAGQVLRLERARG